MDKNYACFVNSEDNPIETKHVCWRVTKTYERGKTTFNLYEIVEEKFYHPDAPKDAFIWRLNIYFRESIDEDNGAEHLGMLKNAQDNCTKIEKSKRSIFPNL